MIAKIIAGEIGRRIAGRDNGLKGALIGAAAPWLLRRAFTPAGMAIIGAIAAKKLYDAKKGRDRDNLRERLDRINRPAEATSPR